MMNDLYQSIRKGLNSVCAFLDNAYSSLEYSPDLVAVGGRNYILGLETDSMMGAFMSRSSNGKSGARDHDDWHNRGDKGKKKGQDGPHVHVDKYASGSHAKEENVRIEKGQDTPE